MTHDEIMNLMLIDGSSHQLIDAVSVAVKERDALRQPLACDDLAEGQTQMVVDAAWVNELVNERERLLTEIDDIRLENYIMSRESAEDSIKLMVLNEVAAERDTARLALTTIAAGIDPFADQDQNWIAAQCDKGLGR